MSVSNFPKRDFYDQFKISFHRFRLEKSGKIIPERKLVKKNRFVENLCHRMAIDNLVPVTEFKQIPYDYYCPNVKNLADRVCSVCGVYFPSKAAVDHHKHGFGCVAEHKLPSPLIPVAQPTLNEETENMGCEENEEDDMMPIITIADILTSAPFEEVSVVITEDDE